MPKYIHRPPPSPSLSTWTLKCYLFSCKVMFHCSCATCKVVALCLLPHSANTSLVPLFPSSLGCLAWQLREHRALHKRPGLPPRHPVSDSPSSPFPDRFLVILEDQCPACLLFPAPTFELYLLTRKEGHCFLPSFVWSVCRDTPACFSSPQDSMCIAC